MSELLTHLEAINARSAAWVAEDPAKRWAGMLTTDLAHWAEYGVTTVADFEAAMALEDAKEARKAAMAYGSDDADWIAECEAEDRAEAAEAARIAELIGPDPVPAHIFLRPEFADGWR